MVTTAASVEWTVVNNEVEALTLEYAWIKEYDPRFNVKYRDDKSYPYLAITMNEEFPRVMVMRGAKRKGVRYFGPYSHAWAIRETMDLLLRVFPIRSCSAGVFRTAKLQGRPCLLGYIDKCSAPCVDRITAEDHRQLATDFAAFMAGETKQFETRLEHQMQAASQELDFERAARLRDDLVALRKVIAKNAIVLPDGTSADIFAMATDELEVSVQVFHVRDGRIRGQRGWISERVEDLSEELLLERLLQQVYDQAESGAIPREVLIPVEVSQHVGKWLTDRAGKKVRISVPQRGDRRTLAQTVHTNAEHALALHKLRRSSDLTARSLALQELQENLGLDQAPLRIECYDVSHTQGTYQVASMVVFEDGLARKNAYRQFNIAGPDGEGVADDTAAIYEVISRRFSRYLADQKRKASAAQAPEPPAVPVSGEVGAQVDEEDSKRFAYPPSLVVVDGGVPQVNAAQRALTDLGIEEITVIGLAKRLEEIWLAGDPFPIVLPRQSEALYLLQRLRDEAHRFAIRGHRSRRAKGMTTSVLDAIPGLGEKKQKQLLAHFKSLKAIRAASIEELQGAPGIGPKLADVIHNHLQRNTNS